MKIAGIIAEYNPLHDGHRWHMAEARRRTGCDFLIVCMDGHFTQRGEPALWSKWRRARMALRCGADAVFELPATHAVRTADAFARGGVAILGGLGADALCFGSEIDDPGILNALADLREDEPPRVSAMIREGLDAGKSHARARGEAISEYLGIPSDAVNSPNLILAAEYVRAIRALKPDMAALPIPRRGGYHDEALGGTYASATAIRAAFLRGDHAAALARMPDPEMPDALHPMDDLLMYVLRSMSVEQMAALPDVSEGLERRLYRLCREVSTREALLEALKCKRYTRARLSRMLTHALLGMTRECPPPRYARLIGLRRDASGLMGELYRRATIPVAASAAELRGNAAFELECRATDLWALLHDDPDLRLPGREFTEPFVRE